MKIQSLAVVVPNKSCINNCAFCVSRMRQDEYPNMMDDKQPLYDLYLRDYMKRLEYARDNGCNTVMLTGTSEPQQNRTFLTYFGLFMAMMDRPFRVIEMQTTGVLLDDNYLRFLRHHVGVNTISLSLSSLSDEENAHYNGVPQGLQVVISRLCGLIKNHDFNLRLSLNMTDDFNGLSPKLIFDACKRLGADQVTFRVLYESGRDTEQDKWIRAHRYKDEGAIKQYIEEHGRLLDVLEFGASRYSVDGLSTVLDSDCMGKSAKQALKFLILRPNCKLYSQWDDPASLIF